MNSVDGRDSYSDLGCASELDGMKLSVRWGLRRKIIGGGQSELACD